jgi:hypothetical protein
VLVILRGRKVVRPLKLGTAIAFSLGKAAVERCADGGPNGRREQWLVAAGEVALLTKREVRPWPAEREEAIKRRIVQRTGRRIQKLTVEMIGNRVRICGCASCYHVKQLALQGALDVLGSDDAARIELNVEVEARPPKSKSRWL